MSLPVWQSRRTEWGGGGGIWVKCAPLLAIATLGLKSCTDLKCVRCCMYGPVHTTTFCGERSPPPSLSPAAVTGRTTHRNLNTSCRCCMRRPARYYLRPRLRRKVSLALARPLPKSGSVFFGLPLVVVGSSRRSACHKPVAAFSRGPAAAYRALGPVPATAPHCTQPVQTSLWSSCGVRHSTSGSFCSVGPNAARGDFLIESSPIVDSRCEVHAVLVDSAKYT
jgi:hypothetical protein